MSDDIFVRKDVYKAEQDNIITAISDTNERVNDLKDAMNRNIAILGIVITALGIVLAGLQIFIAVYK